MKKTFRTFLMIAAAVAAASCGSSDKGQQQTEQAPVERASKVSVATATIEEVSQDMVYTSTVKANAVNNIAPQAGGRIQKIRAEIGDFVNAGQVLAEMDKVSLEQAKLQMVNDSTELGRIKQLYAQGGVSKSDLEAMELAYSVHKTTYENLLENTILRSPISGVVSARNYDKGDMYSGSPLFVVEQITPVKLLAGVSETDYTRVKKGDKVEVTVDAIPGRTFEGRIKRLYPTVDANTHTFNVEVEVQNGNRILRPGMFARVKVFFGSNKSVTVPDIAVVKQQGSSVRYVYVKDGDTAALRVVKIGRHYGNRYEILEGLSEGDVVVTKGSTSLKNGSKIEVED